MTGMSGCNQGWRESVQGWWGYRQGCMRGVGKWGVGGDGSGGEVRRVL
jgi:hypothetical protein